MPRNVRELFRSQIFKDIVARNSRTSFQFKSGAYYCSAGLDGVLSAFWKKARNQLHRHRDPNKAPRPILPWATGLFFGAAIVGSALAQGHEEIPVSPYQPESIYILLERSKSGRCMVDAKVALTDVIMEIAPEIPYSGDDRIFFTLRASDSRQKDPKLIARMDMPSSFATDPLVKKDFNNVLASVNGTFHEAASLDGLPGCLIDIATIYDKSAT